MHPRHGLRALLISALLLAAGAAAAEGPAYGPVKVVAAENFYGDVARQIGGNAVRVTSIISDPNVDPHEYESSIQDAKEVAEADLVIENGGGYDDWMDKLLSASPKTSRIVLKGFELAVKKLPNNEHVWYSVDDMQAVARAISRSLQKLLPRSAADFVRNDHAFQESLRPIQERLAQIKERFTGTPVGLTETIFLYQALPMGLKVLTPQSFQKAVSEGNDPPADAVVEVENQITRGRIKVLINNVQTISPITARAQADAEAAGIPVVAVTETMPSGQTYQSWMLGQLDELRAALARAGT